MHTNVWTPRTIQFTIVRPIFLRPNALRYIQVSNKLRTHGIKLHIEYR